MHRVDVLMFAFEYGSLRCLSARVLADRHQRGLETGRPTPRNPTHTCVGHVSHVDMWLWMCAFLTVERCAVETSDERMMPM